jgi:hypothetical protein
VPVVFRALADLPDGLVRVLRLAAVRPVVPALRAPAAPVVAVFVAGVEARGFAVRAEEAGFAVREVAARVVPAPLVLLLFRDAPAAVAFLAEAAFLTLAVARLAPVCLLGLPVPVLPVPVDFTPRGMFLLLWHACRSRRHATKRKRIKSRKRSLLSGTALHGSRCHDA